jgi:hypothetical protein
MKIRDIPFAVLRRAPFDVLQQASTALDRYVQARQAARLRRERARLEDELAETRASLAEIRALAGHTPTEEPTHEPT